MAELAALITTFVSKFGGVGGLALSFCVYFLVILQKKLDKLVDVNSKMFGLLLALNKKTSEENDK